MIKNLQKKMSFLFILLLSITWISILSIYANNIYRANLLNVEDQVREEIKDENWKNFIIYKGLNSNLTDISYCVYSLSSESDAEPDILFHTFSNKSENELLKEGKRVIAANESGRMRFLKYTYLYKYLHNSGKRYLILISGASAFRATLPTLYGCGGLLLAGILLFAVSGRALSRWLTRPIEEMINSEKKFISNASHELKTPLAVIRTNTQLLQKEVAADNKHLGYINQETERMISLVNKMLTLVRLDTMQNQTPMKQFQVDDALYDIIYPMESVAYEKKICITTDIQEDMYIDGVEDQIQDLLSILLNNAISYTPEAGEIVVRSYLQAKKFYLSVANTGDPIPEETRDRLFERFFRADEAREDNGHYGLGLSIASSIVAHHGGHISVSYEDGKNVFSVVFNAQTPIRHEKKSV